MANERLVVQARSIDPRGGNGRDLYFPAQDLHAPQTVLSRQEFNGNGRQLNLAERQAVVEAAHKMGLPVSRVEVTRTTNNGQTRRLNGDVQSKLVDFEHNEPKIIAKDRYHRARRSERLDRREMGDLLPNSPWTRMWARILERPVGHIKTVTSGLTEGSRNLPFALLDIQDAVTSAVRLHFPEYDNGAVKPANAFLKVMRWRPIAYITSLFPHVDFALDIPQMGADMVQGKGYHRTNQDLVMEGLDFFWSPFLNLAIVGKALDESNAVSRRAIIKLAKEAMSDPKSPYYHARERVAQSILAANAIAHNPEHKEYFGQKITSGRVVQDKLNYENYVNTIPKWKQSFGREFYDIARARNHFSWQGRVAEVIDLANQIVPDFYTKQQAGQVASEPKKPSLIVRKVREWVAKKVQKRLAKWQNKRSTPTP